MMGALLPPLPPLPSLRVEAYCQAAHTCLASGGLFIMCMSEGPGTTPRVEQAAHTAHLTILRKLCLLPKDGLPPLFAVYTMCRAGGWEEGEYRQAVREWRGGGVEEGSCSSSSSASGSSSGYWRGSMVIRTRDGKRTSSYAKVLQEMGMPDRTNSNTTTETHPPWTNASVDTQEVER